MKKIFFLLCLFAVTSLQAQTDSLDTIAGVKYKLTRIDGAYCWTPVQAPAFVMDSYSNNKRWGMTRNLANAYYTGYCNYWNKPYRLNIFNRAYKRLQYVGNSPNWQTWEYYDTRWCPRLF